ELGVAVRYLVWKVFWKEERFISEDRTLEHQEGVPLIGRPSSYNLDYTLQRTTDGGFSETVLQKDKKNDDMPDAL
ncbi:MAG TPA: hypothetical protein VEC08_01225, partial [Nitrososphaerales archaeon]|nr:hypothetical protein [Nitrososphaerales archaeon]